MEQKAIKNEGDRENQEFQSELNATIREQEMKEKIEHENEQLHNLMWKTYGK